MAKHFEGDAGTIYLETNGCEEEKPCEVWYERHCIIGLGGTEIEALEDAARHAVDISNLALNAIKQLRPALTEKESQLIIGAIPLQALPEKES